MELPPSYEAFSTGVVVGDAPMVSEVVIVTIVGCPHGIAAARREVVERGVGVVV